MTGLALMAFLAVGYTHMDRDRTAVFGRAEYVVDQRARFAGVVGRGLSFLKRNQLESGLWSTRHGPLSIENLLPAIASVESYAMTHSGLWMDMARRALGAVVAEAQASSKAERLPCSENMASVVALAYLSILADSAFSDSRLSQMVFDELMDEECAFYRVAPAPIQLFVVELAGYSGYRSLAGINANIAHSVIDEVKRRAEARSVYYYLQTLNALRLMGEAFWDAGAEIMIPVIASSPLSDYDLLEYWGDACGWNLPQIHALVAIGLASRFYIK